MTRRRFFGLALVAGPAAGLAARNWDRAAFPEWSDAYIDKLLTDSPWARPLTLPFRFSAPPPAQVSGSPFAQTGSGPFGLGIPPGPGLPPGRRPADGNAPPVLTEIYLTTRWSSALPVRQALALAQFGRAGLAQPKAEELLRGDAAEYVVDVAGFPAGMVGQGVRRFEAELASTATIYVKGRPAVKASSASVPEHGNHLIATLRFPRLENLSAEDGVIEFAAQVGPMDIRQKFKLHEMQYKGRLEL